MQTMESGLNLSFILFKPDVFLRKIYPELLYWFEQESFRTVDFRCGKLSTEHYHLMCDAQFQCHLDDWNHNRKAYEFAPAAGFLFHDLKAETRNSLQYIRQKKGAALPPDRDPFSLRAQYGSKSRIFNILHVPDDDSQSLREAKSWFGELKNDMPLQFLSRDFVQEEISNLDYSSEALLDPEYTFIKAKQRLAHVLKRQFPELQKLELFYLQWAKAVKEDDGCKGIEGNILQPYQQKEQQLLSTFDAPMNVLKCLTSFYTATSPQLVLEYFFNVLDKWNIFISPLEHYLICSRWKYLHRE